MSRFNPGQALAGFERVMTGTLMRSRYWHGVNSVHSDPELAARQGLKGSPATGHISAAFIQQMCVAFLGEAMFRDSLIEIRFRRPVYENDRLTIGGVVEEAKVEAHGTRLVLRTWCRNQAGEEVTTGRIEAFVPNKEA